MESLLISKTDLIPKSPLCTIFQQAWDDENEAREAW